MLPGYKLVLDVSHHQTFNYDLVKKYVDGFIIRFGFGISPDTLANKHYDGFKEKPCAGYQWFRPDQDVKAQIELVKVKTAGKDIKVFFSDQEQQGMYGVPLSTYSPALLSDRARQHVEGLALHGFDMGIYSRATWISQYAKPMLEWITKYHMWLASWPYAKGAITTSWEELINYWAPKTFSPFYASDWPSTAKTAQAWQWSGDKFIVPGIYTTQGVPRSADFNYVSDALFERFKTGEIIQPPVIDPLPLDITSRVTKLEEDLAITRNELDAFERIARDHGWTVDL